MSSINLSKSSTEPKIIILKNRNKVVFMFLNQFTNIGSVDCFSFITILISHNCVIKLFDKVVKLTSNVYMSKLSCVCLQIIFEKIKK